MVLQALRGTSDLLADDVTHWSAVERTVRRLASLYGYREIRTPLIEDAALFLRAVGETTDIVQKELFRFEDRGGQDVALRPEGTASVVRAYLQHNLHKTQGFAKLLYIGPMFRAERPQAGRFRQFHQYGVEAIGSPSPWVDVEVIVLCLHILRECGVSQTTLWITSMGCRDDQQRSAQQLRERLKPHTAKLCRDCQARLKKNVFRVLDCKKPGCRELAWSGQPSPFLLCEECRAHFDAVRRGLERSGVAFDDTQAFARGLDYYTRTVFEVRAKGLGAKDAVAAGGRYDHLVEDFGGPSVGAVGFAAGMEQLLMAVEAQSASKGGAGVRQGAAPPKRRGVYLALAEPSLLGEAFGFLQELRGRGVDADVDFDGKSLKAQLREADRAGYRLVAILGETEVRQRRMTLKDLEHGGQDAVAFDRFVEEVQRRLPSSCHHGTVSDTPRGVPKIGAGCQILRDEADPLVRRTAGGAYR